MKKLISIIFIAILFCSCNMSKFYANKRINHTYEIQTPISNTQEVEAQIFLDYSMDTVQETNSITTIELNEKNCTSKSSNDNIEPSEQTSEIQENSVEITRKNSLSLKPKNKFLPKATVAFGFSLIGSILAIISIAVSFSSTAALVVVLCFVTTILSLVGIVIASLSLKRIKKEKNLHYTKAYAVASLIMGVLNLVGIFVAVFVSFVLLSAFSFLI